MPPGTDTSDGASRGEPFRAGWTGALAIGLLIYIVVAIVAIFAAPTGGWAFEVFSLYDIDQSKVGQHVNGLPIRHIDDMAADARSGRFAIAIIATPAEAAEVLGRLNEAGIRSVLNFAPAVLRPPTAMEVRNVDLSTELQILSFYRKHGR